MRQLVLRFMPCLILSEINLKILVYCREKKIIVTR